MSVESFFDEDPVLSALQRTLVPGAVGTPRPASAHLAHLTPPPPPGPADGTPLRAAPAPPTLTQLLAEAGSPLSASGGRAARLATASLSPMTDAEAARDATHGLLALLEGMWTDYLLHPDRFDRDEAMRITFRFLAAMFPSYFTLKGAVVQPET